MFFFQAEDGIRDYKVTGVQTCALPISIDAEGRTVHSNTAMAAQAIHDCLAQAGRALGDVGFLASGSSGGDALDRKSTRLNSTHLVISYAGFFLKKRTACFHVCRTHPHT